MEKTSAQIPVTAADSSNACGNAREFSEGRDSGATDNREGNAEKSGASLCGRICRLELCVFWKLSADRSNRKRTYGSNYRGIL